MRFLRSGATYSVLLLALALALALAACGDDAAPSEPDAGVAHDAGIALVPAALPVMTPCPPGWREVPPADPSAPVTCEPYGVDGPAVCARGSAHFPGGAGCEHLGPACPAGEFAEDLPTDRELRFVRPGVDGSPLGTRERPYTSLAQAVTRAPAGAVLVLAKGTYREAIVLPPKDLTILGACVEETILEAPGPDIDRAIAGGSEGRVEFRRLTFTGASSALIAIDTAVLDLEDVLVDRVSFVALHALLGGQITGRRVVVQDTQAVDTFGRAIMAEMGGSVVLSQAFVSGHHDISAMTIDPGSRLTLEDARITDSRPTSANLYGRAIDVELGAQLTLSRAVLDDNAEYGVFSAQPGAVAILSDVVIRDMQLDANGAFGRGLHAQSGGVIRATRMLIDGAREIAIHATAAADPPGDALTLDDVVIRDVGPSAANVGGRGLQAQWGASITARRVYVSDVSELGVFVATAGTSALLEDLTVVDMRGDAMGRFGHGITSSEGAQLTLRRARVMRAVDIGVMVARDAWLDAEDLWVEQVESESDRGIGGIGVYARGVTTLTRVLVRNVRQLGVCADGADARLTATELVVDGVRDSACAATTCSDRPSGIGLAAYVAGAELRVTGFSVAHCALAGVQVGGGVADLAHGRVSDNPIGANVQTAGFDFARLTTDVVFERNERAFDGNLLPIPESRLPGTLAF